MTEARCAETDCEGIAVYHRRCVGHLDRDQLTDYVARLGSNDILDAQGASINGQRCRELVELLASGAFIGDADFAGAQFSEVADFGEVKFGGVANFSGAEFSGGAIFEGAQFSGGALFGVAKFSGGAIFEGAQFGGVADFGGVKFSGVAIFEGAQFSGDVNFGGGKFGGGGAYFEGAQFSGDVNFGLSGFSGVANFGGVKFSGSVDFSGTQFSEADFGGVQFGGLSFFSEAQFSGRARFRGAKIAGSADFGRARFGVSADFGRVQFGGDTDFPEAQFGVSAIFEGARFGGDANFSEAQSGGSAHFRGARFGRVCVLGPLRVETLHLNQAVFEGPATIHAACAMIAADDIRARDSFTLTGRGCDIRMTGARFDAPGRVASSPALVWFPGAPADDDKKPPRLLAVEGTDLSSLTMAGIDLSACRFVGAYNLDKLHIDGPAKFAETPAGWWWTRRMTLAEERHWRARYDRRSTDWYPLRDRLDQVLTLERRALSLDPKPLPPRDAALALRQLADHQWFSQEAREKYWKIRDEVTLTYDWLAARTTAVGTEAARVQAAYRELRKSFEDAKNEPGAADFYYGEMEMRRMASRAAPAHRFENALLTAYWAVSGYGLRASRAFLALLLALAVGTALFATVGFGRTQQTVYVPVRSTAANQPVTYKQMTVPDGKPGFRDAAYYSVQSATSLLREPTSEPLTTIGRITEITLRLLGPLLLGLAVLALRGRVKR